MTTGAKKFRVLKISDITISQRLQISQNQKHVLQMINACVSHEMRNPINSIFAMNLQIREQAQEIAAGLRKITEQVLSGSPKENLLATVSECSLSAADILKHATI